MTFGFFFPSAHTHLYSQLKFPIAPAGVFLTNVIVDITFLQKLVLFERWRILDYQFAAIPLSYTTAVVIVNLIILRCII